MTAARTRTRPRQRRQPTKTSVPSTQATTPRPTPVRPALSVNPVNGACPAAQPIKGTADGYFIPSQAGYAQATPRICFATEAAARAAAYAQVTFVPPVSGGCPTDAPVKVT